MEASDDPDCCITPIGDSDAVGHRSPSWGSVDSWTGQVGDVSGTDLRRAGSHTLLPGHGNTGDRPFTLSVLLLGFSAAVLWLPEATSTIPDPGLLQQSYQLGSGHLAARVLSAPVELLATGVTTWLMVAWLGAMVLAAGLRGRDPAAAVLLGATLFAGLELAARLGLRFGTFTNGWFLSRFYEVEAGRSLILLLLVEVAVLLVLSAMHLIPMLVQKIRPGAEKDSSSRPDRLVPHF